MNINDMLRQPWPWYLAGPLIGLTVPALLLLGNKSFGISSSLRHMCAACSPNIPFFKYDWKSEAWNLFFVTGILLGGIVSTLWLVAPDLIRVAPSLADELGGYGIGIGGLVPEDLFSWRSLFSLRGLIVMAGGGFLVGFGARYSGGCTSGHAIMGLSTLQWPSLVATCCFMAGGLLMSNFLLPVILSI